MPGFDMDIVTTMLADIGAGTPPEQSRIRHTPEMLAYRKKLEAEWEAIKAAHPDAEMHIPSELPRDDIKVQLPTGWDLKGDGADTKQTKGAE